MTIEELFILFGIFVLVITGSFLGSALSERYLNNGVQSISAEGNGIVADPLTVQVLRAWNYANPGTVETWAGGCKLERLSADEWKINFSNCG